MTVSKIWMHKMRVVHALRKGIWVSFDHPMAFIIRFIFLFLFIGQKPTTWPANNCLQMVRSCAMPSNSVWRQIIFCSYVKETTFFSFLRSFLRLKRQIASLPNDKKIIKLGYRKISWFVSVSQIKYFICSPLRVTNHDILLNLVQ